MKRIPALALAALAVGSAQAEFDSGNELLQRMNSESSIERNAAIGYVMGVADVYQGVAYCPPPEVTAGQLRDVVRNYLTNVPAERHLSGDVLVLRVLKAQWPCANNRRNGSGGTNL